MIRFISHIFLLGFLTFSCHSQMVMESSSNESFGFNKKIDTIWRNDIVTQSFPITSLSSNDFADLQFLKDELTSASIVFLGENSHSVREYNLLKVRLIRYLHQELGYSMIAFESSPSNLRYVSDFREKLTPEKMLEMGLFSIWRTEEVRELMEYLKANPSLQLRGFDCQEHALDTHLVAPYYQKLLAGISQQLGDEYSTFIADFKNHTKVLPYNQREAFYQKGRVLEDRLAILQSSVLYDHPEFNVLTHHLNNLRFTLKMASYKDEEAGIAYRDSCMAANILNEKGRRKDGLLGAQCPHCQNQIVGIVWRISG
jgi:erythromycin esterase-like protein